MKCLKCGHCCRHLILESTPYDAKREPRIAAECAPINDGGFFLNKHTPGDDREVDRACTFHDKTTNLCTIYETRPTMCRAFRAGGHNCKHGSCMCEWCVECRG
jgi:Fe-S-cluster containining protein